MINARSPALIGLELQQLLPPSDDNFVFNQDGFRGAIDAMLANGLASAEASAIDMQFEIDPRTAVYTLDAFLRCLGPDGWGINELGMTEQQQAEIAYLRWTAGQDVCAGMFIALAAALGVTIAIAEQRTNVCGDPRSRCGEINCTPTPAQFVWIVEMPAAALSSAYCGAAICGQAWAGGGFTRNLIEGVIAELAPSHTLPIFSYTG